MALDYYLNNVYHSHTLNWKGNHCRNELVWLYTDYKGLVNEWADLRGNLYYQCRFIADKRALKVIINNDEYWFVKLQLGTKCYEKLKDRGWKDIPSKLLNQEVIDYTK